MIHEEAGGVPARRFLHDPETIEVSARNVTADRIEEIAARGLHLRRRQRGNLPRCHDVATMLSGFLQPDLEGCGMKRVTSFVILTGVSALAACASQAPAPATSTETAAVHERVPAATPTAQQMEKIAASNGYRRVMVRGEERFCRSEPVTGSRVQKVEVCLTLAQLQARQADARELMQQVGRWGALSSNSVATFQGGATGSSANTSGH